MTVDSGAVVGIAVAGMSTVVGVASDTAATGAVGES
jgi:hypothetical protein